MSTAARGRGGGWAGGEVLEGKVGVSIGRAWPATQTSKPGQAARVQVACAAALLAAAPDMCTHARTQRLLATNLPPPMPA